LGLAGMIGKGPRNDDVKNAMREYGAIYFAAVGGAAALIAKSITKAEVVAYDDLGPEAIHKLTVEEFPAVVATDAKGNDLYIEGKEKYKVS
jgi:fumarate hydratase subunit beta